MKLRRHRNTRTINKSLLVLAAFVLLFTGCNRHSNGGISSGTGGLPGSSPQAAEISSTSQVVKVEAAPVQIAEGGSADATVKLSILAGYHVNANPATFSYLIPTEVAHAPDPDGFCVRVGKPVYPSASKIKFEFEEEPLAVYEGEIAVKLPLRLLRRSEPGCLAYAMRGSQGSLPIKTTVQACDHEKCFPPAIIDAAIPVEVK